MNSGDAIFYADSSIECALHLTVILTTVPFGLEID